MIHKKYEQLKSCFREEIVSAFKGYGFVWITMDLTVYRTGSMNETLGKEAQIR